ncbi:MAG TPA: hypothetical protein VGF94_08345 [Kofleriaceae bacterium]
MPAWTAKIAYLLPVIVCALAAPAHADGDDQALSVEVGWATFSTQAPMQPGSSKTPPEVSPDIGGSLSVIYERGVSTDLSLRGELAGHVFDGGAAKGQSDASFAGLGDVGAVFRFDVLKYVPYAFGGVGGVWSGGGPIGSGGEFVLVIGGGLDVLASRSRSWGIEGRLASFGGDVTVFSLGLRGTIRWGYF